MTANKSQPPAFNKSVFGDVEADIEFWRLRQEFMKAYGNVLKFVQSHTIVSSPESTKSELIDPAIRLSITVVAELLLSIRATSDVVYGLLLKLVDELILRDDQTHHKPKSKLPLTRADLFNKVPEKFKKQQPFKNK